MADETVAPGVTTNASPEAQSPTSVPATPTTAAPETQAKKDAAPASEMPKATNLALDADKTGTDPAQKDEPAADKSPIDYGDFQVPEGQPQDGHIMQEFRAVASELELPKEQAQKLVDVGMKLRDDLAKQQFDVWKNTQEAWQAQVKSDPEIGGKNLDATLQGLNKLYGLLGDNKEAFKQALDVTGAGNHPGMIKGLAKFASLLTEGGPVTGSPGANKPKGAQALYTKSNMNP